MRKNSIRTNVCIGQRISVSVQAPFYAQPALEMQLEDTLVWDDRMMLAPNTGYNAIRLGCFSVLLCKYR